MGFSRQEYWSGLPFHCPGDLPNPGIEPGSSALQADSFLSHRGSLGKKHQGGLAFKAHQVYRQLYPALPGPTLRRGLVGAVHTPGKLVPRDGTKWPLGFRDPITYSPHCPLRSLVGGGHSRDEDAPSHHCPQRPIPATLPAHLPLLSLLIRHLLPQLGGGVNVVTFVREQGGAHSPRVGEGEGQSPRAPGLECAAHPQPSAHLRLHLGGPGPPL